MEVLVSRTAKLIQVLRQRVLAARTAESIGHQHQRIESSLPAFGTRLVLGAKPSRILSRPNSRHKQRSTSSVPSRR